MREVDFKEKDAPLRADVRYIGALVGSIISEQGGDALFALVEGARQAAIARREGKTGGDGLAALTELDTEQATVVARSFTTWFRAVNLVERTHRIRRLRERLHGDGAPAPDSLLAAFQELQEAGTNLDRLQELIRQVEITPVLTAHPTQATRRTILAKQQQMLTLLVQRLNPALTQPELTANEGAIRSALTSSWQTDPHPEVRPTVEDELEQILFYVTDILFRVVPPFFESLRAAAVATYGHEAERSFRLPPLLRFGSWVGGDMDGNPNVNAATMKAALDEQRRRVLRLYSDAVAQLAGDLSQCTNYISVSPQVANKLHRYAEMFPQEMDAIRERHRNMPYRCLLQLMGKRLKAVEEGDPAGYRSSAEFASDVLAIRESLRANKGEHAGMFAVNRLLMQARTFGFHLVTLDVRQDARDLRKAVGAGLDDPEWASRTPAERRDRLVAALTDRTEPVAADEQELKRCLAVFATIKKKRDELGERALGANIISMCENADDVLSVLLLAQWAGCVDDEGNAPLDIAPLFETLDDLKRGAQVMQQLFELPLYAAHLASREQRQIVMLGYSDSNKDAGILASRLALDETQRQLGLLCQQHEVELTVFHGRGGSVSRGGGRLSQGVRAIPPAALNGRLRATEQGEAIDQKFGARGIALRNLEQMTSATLLALAEPVEPTIDPRWKEAVACAAEASTAKYRELLNHPQFVTYFQNATPIDVIERLRIGSRPARRQGATDIRQLRAIPWVFAWGQSRHGLPGWYGVGAGLEAARSVVPLEELREALNIWPFFGALIDDTEMVMGKSDLDIAARYAELAPDESRVIFDCVQDEFARATSQITALTGCGVLERDAVLQRAVRLRNPYIDPLSVLQVELLRRWRAEKRRDDGLFGALTETLWGIAEGLQNTG